MNVLSRAVEKLSIDWPVDRQESKHKSKLDERFLPSRSQPSRRWLPFFPDLHTEVSKTWARPVSSRIYTINLTLMVEIIIIHYNLTL